MCWIQTEQEGREHHTWKCRYSGEIQYGVLFLHLYSEVVIFYKNVYFKEDNKKHPKKLKECECLITDFFG